MSRTKKHCEPLVAVWLRPSTTEPCICCKQVAEKPRGEHLKIMYICMYVHIYARAFSVQIFTKHVFLVSKNKAKCLQSLLI